MLWAALAFALTREEIVLPRLDAAAPTVSIEFREERLEKPKRSPSQKQEYFYQAVGLAELDGPVPRFRVFSQTEETHRNLAKPVARMFLRLWQLSYAHYGRDHAERYNRQLVDVYLTEAGEPGGEQLFGMDPDTRKDVNAIFIYDLKSFTEPFEMAREIAHEYGHATLPPVGGYKEGESWINGDMGEMIYIRALRDEMRANMIAPEDTMGATLGQMNQWVTREVDPMVARMATGIPGTNLIKRTLPGREAFLGFAAYAQGMLPVAVWRRSLALFGSTHAEDYLGAVVEAVSESSEDVVLSIPASLRQTPIWVPFKNKRKPNVNVLARIPGWIKVDPAGAAAIRLGSTAKPEESFKVGDV